MTNSTRSNESDDWDTHWAQIREGMLRNPAYRYRLRRVEARLQLPTAGAQEVRFIDIGCGDGSFAARLARLRPDVEIVGIDSSQTGVTTAAAVLPSGRFYRLDLLEPEFEPPKSLLAWGSHALCSEVLEHLDDPVLFLRRAREFVSPGGIMILTVPAGPRSAFDVHLGHRRHYTSALLREQLAAAGWEIERIDAAGFPFHNLYRLMVVASGDVAVTQAIGRSSWLTDWATKALSRAFDFLFRLNLPTSPWGWQIVARARLPQ